MLRLNGWPLNLSARVTSTDPLPKPQKVKIFYKITRATNKETRYRTGGNNSFWLHPEDYESGEAMLRSVHLVLDAPGRFLIMPV